MIVEFVQSGPVLVEVAFDSEDAVSWRGVTLSTDFSAPSDRVVPQYDLATDSWTLVAPDTLVTGGFVNATGDTMTGDLVISSTIGRLSLVSTAPSGRDWRWESRSDAALYLTNATDVGVGDVLMVDATGDVYGLGAHTWDLTGSFLFVGDVDATSLAVSGAVTLGGDAKWSRGSANRMDLGGGDILYLSGASLVEVRSASNQTIVRSMVTGSAAYAFEITTQGVHSWGDGTSAVDTNLYRSAANVLKTDDTFIAAAIGIGVTPTAGVDLHVSTTDDTVLRLTNGTDSWDIISDNTPDTLRFKDVSASVDVFTLAPTGASVTGTLSATGAVTTGVSYGFSATGAHASGTIFKSSANGLAMSGVAGSSYDWSVIRTDGTGIVVGVPTGTGNLQVVNTLGVGTAPTTAKVKVSAGEVYALHVVSTALSAGVVVVEAVQTSGNVIDVRNNGIQTSGAALFVKQDHASATAPSVLIQHDGTGHGLYVQTGTSRFDASVGIGTAPQSTDSLYLATTSTSGATQYGLRVVSTYSSAATAATHAITGRVYTAAAAFTVASAYALYLGNASLGAGSAITTQFGIYIEGMTSGATNYAIYTSGSTASYFGGAVTLTGGFLASAESEFKRTNASDVAFHAKLTGDGATYHRFGVRADGMVLWGDATGAFDVSLSRGAANRLDVGSGDSLQLSGGGYLSLTDTAYINTGSTSASTGVFYSRVTGDANYRFKVEANGAHYWGDGTAAADVSLSRGAANRLDLGSGDSLLLAGGGLSWVSGTGYFYRVGDADSNTALGVRVSGDALNRFEMLVSGHLSWGDGAATRDVTLSRGAANRLDLGSGDSLQINTGAIIFSGAGSANGTAIYQSAANGLLLRAATGSSYDFLIQNPAAAFNILHVPTGTLNVVLGGNLSVPGTVAFGDTAVDYRRLYLYGALPGTGSTNQQGLFSDITVSTNATGSSSAVYGRIRTPASVFTASQVNALYAANATKGAGSTITAQYGLYVESLTSGDTNYAIYTAGATASYFGGTVYIGDLKHMGSFSGNGARILFDNTNGLTIQNTAGAFVRFDAGANTVSFGSGGTWDVTLGRGAANRLDLGSGDSFLLTDGRVQVTHTASAADGLYLAGLAAVTPSPRIFFVSDNATTAANTIYRATGGGGLVFSSGGTHGSSSGTVIMSLSDAGNLTLNATSPSLQFGADVTLSRGAANRLDLAAGDALMLQGGGNGNLGIGVAPRANVSIDIVNSAAAGAQLAGSSTTTDATVKAFRIAVRHYTNAEEDTAVIQGISDSANSWVEIGGGTSVTNAVTTISLYTAANTTTTTGTLRFRVNAAGNSSVGTHSLLFGTFSSEDVSLTRGAANRLDLGNGDSALAYNGAWIGQADVGTTVVFRAYAGADTNNRWQATAVGTLEWGSGSATPDVNLYRSAANVLKTDDALVVAGALTVSNASSRFGVEDTTGHTITVSGGGAGDMEGGQLTLECAADYDGTINAWNIDAYFATMRVWSSAGTALTVSTSTLTLADAIALAWSDVSLTRGAANRLDLGSGDSLAITGGGKLGVGQTSPDRLFVIQSDSDSTGSAQARFASYNNTAASGSALLFSRGLGTGSVPLQVGANDVLGTLQSQGYKTATGFINGASIAFRATGAPSSNTPTEIVFTSANGTVYPETVLTNAGVLSFTAYDMGSGAAGRSIVVSHNSNATPGAGFVTLNDKGATGYRVWADDSGLLRIHTADPTNANDTAGTVVGDQTSDVRLKDVLGRWDDFEGAYNRLRSVDLWSYRFKDDSRRRDKVMQGFVIRPEDRGGWWSMDDHRPDSPASLDIANVLGTLVGATKYVGSEVEILKARVAALEAEVEGLRA